MSGSRGSSFKYFVRIAVDIAMTILLFILMAHVLTDATLHEVLGVCLFALFALHHALNLAWYRSALAPRGLGRRLWAAVNWLLLVAMIVAAVSSVMVSRQVFAFVGAHGGLFARKLHSCATSWCFLLMSVHIGLHWSALSKAVSMLRRPVPGPARKAGGFRKMAALAAGILVSAYGVYASFTHELGAKLVMYYGYSFWDPERSKLLFFEDLLAIMGLYVCATRCAIALTQAKAKNERRLRNARLGETVWKSRLSD
jgi:hypothetical protein